MLQNSDNKLLMIKPPYEAWPVGFAYVLTCLEAHNIPFDFIDASRSGDFKKDLKDRLTNNSYIAVASGGLIGMFRFFKGIAKAIHKYQAGIPFILGGNITKDSPNDLLFEHIGMNIGVLGEAEMSLPNLINAINSPNDLCRIPGIICKHEGNIIRNQPKRLDLNNYIVPAWHRFDADFYIKNSSSPFIGNNLNFMPVLTGRGCVGRCTFCSPSIGGFRKRPIEHVMREIEHLFSEYDFDKIMFYNEMFYPTVREINDFCDQYILLKNRKQWIAQIRVDSNIDAATFAKMKNAGCIVVSAGIESGSDKVLNLMNKRVTSGQIKEFFRKAKVVNIPANGTFIVGNEGETEEDVAKTIDLVIDEEINAGESLMYVYHGTTVYDNALKRGLIKNEMLHLKKTSRNTTALFAHNVKENHLNISEMPDDRFLDILIREVRRYNTFVFNRYPVKELSCKIEVRGREVLMLMNGKCHECGADVGTTYKIYNSVEYMGLLGLGVDTRYICPKCYNQLAFNIYTCEEMNKLREHYSFIKERISKYNSIIIGGLNEDAMSLLRINMLGLDYTRIQGFVEFTKLHGYKHYVNYPVFNLNDIKKLDPDCILMADCISDGEELIRKIYNKNKKPLPDLIYLFDNQLLDTLKKIKSDTRYGNRYNNLIVWSRSRYSYLVDYCDNKGINAPEFISDLGRYFKNKFYKSAQ